MDVPDFLLKVGGLVATVSLSYLAFIKHREEGPGNDASTEGQLLDNLRSYREELAALVGEVSKQRSQLNQQSDTIENNADQIKELNSASIRHGNDLAEANAIGADYKAKWEQAVVEISVCRTVAEKARDDLDTAMLRIGKLEAEIRRLGGLGGKITNGEHAEAVIEEAAADKPEAPAPPADKPFVPPGEPLT